MISGFVHRKIVTIESSVTIEHSEIYSIRCSIRFASVTEGQTAKRTLVSPFLIEAL